MKPVLAALLYPLAEQWTEQHRLANDVGHMIGELALEIRSFWRNGPSARTLRALDIGRNEPCPCGSGKKFKKCCGSPVSRQVQPVH
jgi:uncharacterized protein YecA (UPF0149 family)